MREIKFRAYDIYSNDVVSIKTIDFEADGSAGCVVDFDGINLDVSECVLMQYTGLKDKNGVDIYFDDALTNGEMTRIVIWREDDSQIQLSVNDDNHDNRIKLTQHLIDEFGLIVCGNIYENPELLEVQNG